MFWPRMQRAYCALFISFSLTGHSAPLVSAVPVALERVETHLSKLATSSQSDADKDAEEARLLYWKAKYLTRKDGKSEAATELLTKALELAESARNAEPKNPRALRSWIAAKGELASTKGALVALSYLKPIKQVADRLADEFPDFESRAGDRILAHLYRVVPRVVSFGSIEKSKFHIERAISNAGHYPENKLVYAEWLESQSKHAEAKKVAQEVLDYSKWEDFPIQETDWKLRAEKVLESKGSAS